MLPNADPVHKITIVARGMAGGYTRFLPDEDRHLWTPLPVPGHAGRHAWAGMLAEELVFGEMTTGPQDDLERATKHRPPDGHPVRHERAAGPAHLRHAGKS